MINELIHSVESVFSSGDGNVLNEQHQLYYIPLYQRGYKWTTNQIEKLLTDIDKFEQQPGKFYCVQNITLVPNSEKKCYNVVDGQQRLTTMSLLLSVLDSEEIIKDKLAFPENSIRHYTNLFLKEFVIEKKELPTTWQDFIETDRNFDHQDIYHLWSGYRTIEKWIGKNIVDRDAFRSKLLTDVKFICNIIEGEKEEKIFGNLNSKRIYLDGADLVRALLITRVTQEAAKTESLKDIVRINERRIRIGWELDHINQWWNQEDVKSYFEPYIQVETSGDIHFDLDQHPINKLLCLYAASEEWESLSLEEIEKLENSTKLYHDLQKLHHELMEWYTHPIIFHYLGFLFHQSRKTPEFSTILNYWRYKCNTKQDFCNYLLQKIKLVLFGSNEIDQIFGEDKEWYSEDNLVPILVFLDIIEALKKDRKKLHVSAFLKKNNDIEHIYPQNPRTETDKRGYLEYLMELNPEMRNDQRIVDNKISAVNELVLDEIIQEYSQKVNTDSIGNLVLLYYKLNRSIQNKSYAFKRKKVLDFYNKGNYIQPHTLKVFSRYFQDSNSEYSDNKFWSQIDILENEKHIKSTLTDFFNLNKLVNNES